MLTLEFLSAKHGDSILVRWTTSERECRMIVDGGPDGVYEGVLRPRLMDLAPKNGGPPIVDVLCLTHVDDDHVVGVIRLLKELRQARTDGIALPFDLRRVWFNSVDDLVDKVAPGLAASVQSLVAATQLNGAVVASYGQGRDVRNSIAALNLDGNKPFGHLLTVGSGIELYDLYATVVGPSTTALATLAEKWRKSMNLNKAVAPTK